MDVKHTALARTYAQAFLNVFPDAISLSNYKSLVDLEGVLGERRYSMVFFSLPHVSMERKMKALEELTTAFGVHEAFKKLFKLLVEHNRAWLAHEITRQLCFVYRQRNNIAHFRVESPHELSSETMKTITAFLVRATQATVITEPRRTENLIAGIRLESDTLAWEYSVAKHLRNLRRTFNAGHMVEV